MSLTLVPNLSHFRSWSEKFGVFDNHTDITLLSDPTSALSVTGTPELREDGKTSLAKIHFRSPGGAVIEFDQEGFKLPSDEEGIAVKYGHIKYHDVTITDHWGNDHAKTKVCQSNTAFS